VLGTLIAVFVLLASVWAVDATRRRVDRRPVSDDAVVVADYWNSEITGPQDLAAQADLNADGFVNEADLAIVLDNLGTTGWGPSQQP